MILKQEFLYDLTEENWAHLDPEKEVHKQKGLAIEHWLLQITGGGSPDLYTHWDLMWTLLDGLTLFGEVKSTGLSYISISPEEIHHMEVWLARGVDTIIFDFIQMNPRNQFKFVGSTLFSLVKNSIIPSKFPDGDSILPHRVMRQHHLDIDLPTGQPTAPLVLKYP